MAAISMKSIVLAADIPPIHAVQFPDGRLGATLRSLCRALSLNFSGQLQHLRRKDALASALVTATVKTDPGKREVAVLLVWAIPIWLTDLQSTRLSSAKRDVVLILQRQAVQAIYEAFWVTSPQPSPKEASIPVSDELEERLAAQEARLTSRLAASEHLLAAAIERLLEHERRLNGLRRPGTRKLPDRARGAQQRKGHDDDGRGEDASEE